MIVRTRRPAPRWALSFADLCLLLLGFFVILQAHGGDAAGVGASVRAAFGGNGMPTGGRGAAAATLFEPGEALFRPGRARAFEAIGRAAAASGGQVTVESAGADRAGNRLDGWELSAARAAAVARAIGAGGLDDARIRLVMVPAIDTDRQRIRVVSQP